MVSAHRRRRTPTGETRTALVRRARRMDRLLAETYPDAHCELDFTTPARAARGHDPLGAVHRPPGQPRHARPCSRAIPTAAAYAAADRDELEDAHPARPASSATRRRRSSGWARRSASATTARCPGGSSDLVTLPGVGRKTANVVLGNAFGVPGITVDTHFGRLVRRFGWTEETDPDKVEAEIGGAHPAARLDDAVAPRDLARPALLPRQEAGVRRLPAGPAVPGVRHRSHRPAPRPRSSSRPRVRGDRPVDPPARPGRSARPALLAALRRRGDAGTPRRRPRPHPPRPDAGSPAASAPADLVAAADLADCPTSDPVRRRARGRAARPHPPLPRRRPGRAPRRACAGTPTVVNVWASWCGPCREELLGVRRPRGLGRRHGARRRRRRRRRPGLGAVAARRRRRALRLGPRRRGRARRRRCGGGRACPSPTSSTPTGRSPSSSTARSRAATSCVASCPSISA